MDDWRLVSIPTSSDNRGSLSALESGEQVPFDIERAFYIYDVPSGAERGHHAHERTEQFLIVVSGSVQVDVESATCESSFTLDSPNEGLYLDSRVWTVLSSFSDDCILVVFASTPYDSEEYIESYQKFTNTAQPHDQVNET